MSFNLAVRILGQAVCHIIGLIVPNIYRLAIFFGILVFIILFFTIFLWHFLLQRILQKMIWHYSLLDYI